MVLRCNICDIFGHLSEEMGFLTDEDVGAVKDLQQPKRLF